NFGAILS
nr:Chain A, NFGAIL segment from human islet amyloid polypeptide [unidentified]2KIB_B Chain B, NFGAIL segment from human islet amyloid polypeptide [unidentified]2KIB_C Chain C, NFGAIL segment from human islet amyloid polypeptide [unidentified]2KIB_D Chain D, NFGAIL segment from human islet amyloid polypeptide [unidentified]2KIB_E Chain E, NFGAIL segment from human islet amyloid polypeptide [unidentified]2KIB_F Chain F, NFGAIL segment from human islet amyloid polypeptide [unidentified]2KIB_G Ch